MPSIANLAVQLTLRTAAFSRGISRAQRELLNTAQVVGQLGRKATRVGLIINGTVAAGLLLAAKAGAEFESSMARVDAITQATEIQFTALSRAARDMGEQTIFTATQAAEALREFAQAGFDVQESLTALRPVLDFAVAGNLDIAEAADIAARILRGLGLQAEDLEKSLNVLTKAFTKAPVTVQELGEAFKFVGPVGRAAGKEIEELTAVLTIFARAGLRGEQAGTALRNILLRLQAQPTEVRKALEQLGIEVADSSGKLKSLATIFEQVRIATANMTEVERQAIISRIAGIRATAAFSAAMEAGADEVRNLEREFSVFDNTMGRISDRVLVTAESKFLLLRSAITETLLTINDKLLPTLKATLDFIINLTKATTAWIDENEALAKGLVITTAIIGTLAIALGVLTTALVTFTVAFIAFKAAIAVGAIAVAGTIAFFIIFAAAIGAVVLATKNLIEKLSFEGRQLKKNKERLEALNITQKGLIKTNKALASITKTNTTLQEKLTKAMSEQRFGDAAKIELKLQEGIVRQAEIRLNRVKQLVMQRRLLGISTERDLISINRTTAEYEKQIDKLIAIKAGVKDLVRLQKQLSDEAARNLRQKQLEKTTNDLNKIILTEEINLISKKSDLRGQVLATIQREAGIEGKILKILSESGLAVTKRAELEELFLGKLAKITKERLRLIEVERSKRIEAFVSTERQLALIRLRAQRDEVLSIAKTAAQRLLIEKAFQRKRADLLEKFRKEDEKANKEVEAKTLPGAFREGTVEAFRAAFGRNPLLDEAKKQTFEQEKINDNLDDIETAVKAVQLRTKQAKIAVG